MRNSGSVLPGIHPYCVIGVSGQWRGSGISPQSCMRSDIAIDYGLLPVESFLDCNSVQKGVHARLNPN
jgi:hypothetical protein